MLILVEIRDSYVEQLELNPSKGGFKQFLLSACGPVSVWGVVLFSGKLLAVNPSSNRTSSFNLKSNQPEHQNDSVLGDAEKLGRLR
jgi:hypothetical protein